MQPVCWKWQLIKCGKKQVSKASRLEGRVADMAGEKL